ncbi:MAG: SidA/IucD/PvdA family monooxygenase [Coxiellaceae bacterium]|nr:SidA/IucD/PvdA family monooxygenase [Coxiellaceae bacterium]
MKTFDWVVIGAGPAGILSVGKLLDAGVDAKQIAWVDPEFKVGDLGKRWRQVSSNTKVKLFVDFLTGCRAFNYQNASTNFDINHLDPKQTCDLYYIADPLQWVSDHLCETVTTYQSMANHIKLSDRVWNIELEKGMLTARNVVLAIGSNPKVLPFVGPEVVSLQDVLDPDRVGNVCSADDTVAVFGSSHSAVLILKNLIDSGVKRVINFYLEPLRYAVEMDGWILFDNTGLKGKAADWARTYIDGELPKNLERHISSNEHLTQLLPDCNKVVYAVGFERRHLPVIAGMETVQYNDKSGIIAPGLFGFGLAFPECRTNPLGIDEYSVGLWKFMDYIDRVLPIWMKYGT